MILIVVASFIILSLILIIGITSCLLICFEDTDHLHLTGDGQKSVLLYPQSGSYGEGCGGADLFSQGLYAAAAEKMHISENVHAYTEDDDDFNIFSTQEEDSDYPLNAPQDNDDDDEDDGDDGDGDGEGPGSALLEQLISSKLRDFVTVEEDGCIQVNMAEQISITL